MVLRSAGARPDTAGQPVRTRCDVARATEPRHAIRTPPAHNDPSLPKLALTFAADRTAPGPNCRMFRRAPIAVRRCPEPRPAARQAAWPRPHARLPASRDRDALGHCRRPAVSQLFRQAPESLAQSDRGIHAFQGRTDRTAPCRSKCQSDTPPISRS